MEMRPPGPVRDVQAAFATYAVPGLSVVDELIVERQADARSEQGDAGLDPSADRGPPEPG